VPDDRLIFEKRVPYTIVRNEVFDEVMPKVSYPAWKVLSAIIRATMGWRKTEDQLSYSQLMERTGIGSPNTLSTAIDELVSGGYVKKRGDPRSGQSNRYELNEEYVLILTTTASVDPPPDTSTASVEGGLQKVYTQNKSSKESITSLTAGRQQTTVPKADTPHHRLVAWYIDQIAPGYAKRYEGKFVADCKAIKQMLERGHSEEKIKGCYLATKRDRFWTPKHLPMRHIDENIDDWSKNETHSRGDGGGDKPAWVKEYGKHFSGEPLDSA
jgi:hypothetical protein